MATSTLDLAARIRLDSTQWTQGLNGAAQRTRGFTATVKQSFASLHGILDTTVGKLAAIGGGFSAINTIAKSAQVDRQLTMIKQTAGLTAAQTKELREELKAMSTETGVAFESLMEGFGGLAAGGLSFEQALPTIEAINKTVRVTGSETNTLVQALQMAQTHFNFDLAKPGQAQLLLDQMTQAGRAGVIELEDLSQAFAASAANAKRAGLSFEETLAIYEGFGTATTKDRLGTLVSSTLAVFTNAAYMKEAQKATGVRFFDEKGERRNALTVIADIKAEYDKLTTDKARFNFISKAFAKADKDTVIGISQALAEGNLEQILKIAAEVKGASGTIERDLAESMDNAVAQANKLRERMGAAADAFAMPLNAIFTKASKLLVGKREEGGLELTDKQLAAGGLLAIGGLFAGKRLAGGALSKLLGGGASLASGVAMGEALEQAGAATPVFIVGAAPGVFSGAGAGLPGGGLGAAGRAAGTRVGTGGLIARGVTGLATTGVGALATGGVAGAATLAAGVGAAGLAGWGIGTAIHENLIAGTNLGDMIGEGITRALAAFGHDEAQSTLNTNRKLELQVQLSDERARITLRSNDADTSMSIRQRANLGAMMRPPSVVN